ncbi:MAG TPA: cyclic pyranopterin monophosphate synthase MoaC [Mycobacteriales bacterium]|nr:cyclic pyranopterin monophosphate synthase MoaC [Mycobacteriales bacterium]
MPDELTHVDDSGAARMVDVTAKEVSARVATATGVVVTTDEVVALVRTSALKKGDAIGVARIAAIMAAKRTPDLLPLCHPIAIGGVHVDIDLHDEGRIAIAVEVKTNDRTGVEMEALTAVAVAGLTIIDMIKAVDPAAVLTDVAVTSKHGGKTGDWIRPADR